MRRFFFFSLILIFCMEVGAFAKENVLGLDTGNSYTVYINNGDDVATITGVEIIDFREFSGIVFLVVRESGFGSKSTEGLIRLDAIQAVLPTLRALKLQNADNKIQ